MQTYTRDALPDSFKNMFTPLSEPNRTNSFKLDRIKNNSLAHFILIGLHMIKFYKK